MSSRIARTLHTWLAIVVGLQALVWMVSGLFMVAVDLDFVHGDRLVRNLVTELPGSELAHGLNDLRAGHPEIEQVRIKGLPGFDQPLYEVSTPNGLVLIDATSGAKLSPLSHDRIAALANNYYAGSGRLAGVELLVSNAPLEIQSRPLPLWRANFDDWLETTLYVHPDTGELVTRRHRIWRWFDFFWMLHIMDYAERSDVNNTLLRVLSLGGIALAISGLWLVYVAFGRRRGRAD